MQGLVVAALGLLLFSSAAGADVNGGFDGQTFYLHGHSAGDEGHKRNADPSASGSSRRGAASATAPAPWVPPGTGPRGLVCDAPDWCPGSPAEQAAAKTPAPAPAPGTPGLDDVARFLVGNPTVTSEPSGWTIVGAQTNFISSAGERERSGQLLGQPVTVHFTPVSYTWRYGDGSGQTVSTPGASWAASGLPQFAKTATSHAYENRGTYTVTVTVAFSARYQFAGQAWADIPGTLALTSDPITVTVKGVKTVLVGKTCVENPSGPGC